MREQPSLFPNFQDWDVGFAPRFHGVDGGVDSLTKFHDVAQSHKFFKVRIGVPPPFCIRFDKVTLTRAFAVVIAIMAAAGKVAQIHCFTYQGLREGEKTRRTLDPTPLLSGSIGA